MTLLIRKEPFIPGGRLRLSPKPDARGFYIPRDEMPQVDEKDLPTLVASALVDRHAPTFEVVSPHSLHAHQRVNHVKAEAMPAAVYMKPCLVSADNYVLDGNHRWFAHEHNHAPLMNVIRINLPFNDALDYLFKQPYTYRIDTTTPERN